MESTKEKLKRLYKIKKENGCVAFGRDKNEKFYYAVEGKATNPFGLKEIEKIIGISPVFCGYNYSFTELKPTVPIDALKIGEDMLERLHSGEQELEFDLIGYRLFRVMPFALSYENRYFTCAEKKILGYAEFADIKIKKIYTTKAPCYYCLPSIVSVGYLFENQMVRNVKKESGQSSLGVFTFHR